MAATQIVPDTFRVVTLSSGKNAWQALDSAKKPIPGAVYMYYNEPHSDRITVSNEGPVYAVTSYGAARRDYCMDQNDPAFEEGWERQRNRRKEYRDRRKRSLFRRPSWMGQGFESIVLEV